jgi:predicted dienelactone hydrolase
MLRWLVAVVCVVAGTGPVWAQGAPAFRIGFRLATGAGGGEKIPLAVWYPTRASSLLGYRHGAFRLKVAKDASPADGRFGLIAISHGTGGGFLNHRSIAAALARAGYVVVAVHHPGSTWQDGSRIGRKIAFARRPAHLSGAIDWALKDAQLGPLIDRRRIGAIGYSAGGYTVLAALGGRANIANVTVHCWVNREDSAFCGFERARRREEGPLDRASGRLPIRRDPRIRAAILWAPVGAIFDKDGMARVTAHLRLYRAGKDRVLRRPWHATYLHRILKEQGKTAEFVSVPDAGHFAFITPFPLIVRPFAKDAARDPAGFDRAAYHRRLAPEIVAYFNRRLR